MTFTARVTPCDGHEGDVIELYRGARLIAAKPSNTLCAAIFKVKVKQRKKAIFTAASPRQDDDHAAGRSEPVKVKVKRKRR